MLFPVNYSKMTSKFYSFLWVFLPKLERAVVVAELAERSRPTPKVRGSNPFRWRNFKEYWFTVNCIERTKIKEKEAENGQFYLDLNHFWPKYQLICDLWWLIIFFSLLFRWQDWKYILLIQHLSSVHTRAEYAS